MPRISVIMPFYNPGPYLKEAVESILRQTYRDIELVLYNDGSDDDSVQYLDTIYDPRVRIKSSSVRLGHAVRTNAVIRASDSEFIARMDADDICVAERLMQEVALLESRPEIGAVSGWAKFIGQHSGVLRRPEYHDDIVAALVYNNAMVHSASMIRRDVLARHHLQYEEKDEPAQDYRLWVDLSRHAKLYNIPAILVKYRVHAANRYARSPRRRASARKIREHHLCHLFADVSWDEEYLNLHHSISECEVEDRNIDDVRRWYATTLAMMSTHAESESLKRGAGNHYHEYLRHWQMRRFYHSHDHGLRNFSHFIRDCKDNGLHLGGGLAFKLLAKTLLRWNEDPRLGV
jgi:glycosyltransferase involved in cell wall biosynthesis